MESMSSNRRLIESGGARVDGTLEGYLDIGATALECVIAPPRLVLEVLVGLVLHLINATFCCASFS